QANGRQGYIEMAKQTMANADRIREGIRSFEELEIIGDPKCSLVAYRSKDPYNVNIFAVGDIMQEKGWHIDRLIHPDGLHAMITCSHDDAIDRYFADLREAVDAVKGKPELALKGEAATYSTVGHIPLLGMVRSSVLNVFSQSYEISKGLIDISDSTQVTGGGMLDKITNNLVMADLKNPGSVKKLVNGAKAAGVIGASAAAVGTAFAIAKKKIKK
ncbi:MAG: hypothetical protein IJN81_09820, partial [Clostridia bacterium]|nr:hypothetical protein [Clostridia bacterium]